MARKDVHRPSAINPVEYDFVAFDYIKTETIGDCWALIEARRVINEHMVRTGGTYSKHEHGGSCHICGAHALYTVLFYHAPTNTYIRTGFDCAEKLEMGHGDFNAFRTSIMEAKDLQTGKRKAQTLLLEAGLPTVWQIAQNYKTTPAPEIPQREDGSYDNAAFFAWERSTKDERVLNDIVNAVVRYGNLSEPRAKYLAVLADRIARKPEIEAKRAAERALAADCPSGRVVITGTVLKLKEHESDFGTTTKMTVKAKEGFVVWCSVPSGSDPEVGSEVTFKATVTPNEADPKFGFAKRPVLV